MATSDTPSWWQDPVSWALTRTSDLVAAAWTGKITETDKARIEQETIDGMKRAGATAEQIQQFQAEYERLIAGMGGTAQVELGAQLGTLGRWAAVGLIALAVILVVREVRK